MAKTANDAIRDPTVLVTAVKEAERLKAFGAARPRSPTSFATSTREVESRFPATSARHGPCDMARFFLSDHDFSN
jgi:hypothetical protein